MIYLLLDISDSGLFQILVRPIGLREILFHITSYYVSHERDIPADLYLRSVKSEMRWHPKLAYEVCEGNHHPLPINTTHWIII